MPFYREDDFPNKEAPLRAEREAAVPALIGRLSEDVGQLEVLSEKLQSRLRPIMQEAPEKAKTDGSAPTPVQPCQLAHELFSLHDSIFRSNRVLQGILDKLEV